MKPSNEVPSAAEFGLLRAFLVGRFQEHGRSGGQAQMEVDAIIGSATDLQTRASTTDKLKTYFKAAPKGV